jgi:hypothetical protein
MTTKLNEKLEFLRSGSEQDLLKEFKKNKALINRLGSVRKKFDEVFKEAKERARLDKSRDGDDGIIMFHENPGLIFEFFETIQKMEIEVDYQNDELVLPMLNKIRFKSEIIKGNNLDSFEMGIPVYKIDDIKLIFPKNTNPNLCKYIDYISNNLKELDEGFLLSDRTFYYSPFEQNEYSRILESVRSMISNQGNVVNLIFDHRAIDSVRVTLSFDQNGKLFITNNKNRKTILDFYLSVARHIPRFEINPIDPDINNDFFDYTFGKISEDDFLLKLIKIFKKEAKKVLS